MTDKKQKTILLVVNDPDALLESEQLKTKGYAVIHVKTGEDAVKAVDENSCRIDLLLIDIDPREGLEGIELTENILKKRDVPVVFLYSHIEPEIAEKTVKIPASGYVKKGSGITVLDVLIKTAFRLFDENRYARELRAEKQCAGIAGGQDASGYENIEEEIRWNAECHKDIFEINKAIKLIIDPTTGLIVDANMAACNFYGYSKEDILNMSIGDINILSGEEVRIEMQKAKNEKKLYFNFKHKLCNGEISDVEVYSGPVKLKSKQYLYSIIHDVTERKKIEKNLEKTYRQNEVLLRELQHRAKNSFNMITSMIKLAATTAVTEAEKNILDEVGLRVGAVSEMYDLLYSTDSIKEVSLDQYLDRIAHSFHEVSRNITMQKKLSPVVIPVKKAVPIGVIVAELMTNSIKHAFPENQEGTVSLSLGIVDNCIIIEVGDNGIGLPEKCMPHQGNTLGLKLVSALVDQVGGSFENEKKDGTCFVLNFPVTDDVL